MKAKEKAHTRLTYLILSAMFAALTAVGAFIKIPAGYTSFTLQVFFTLMAGVLLGPYYGMLSQVIYVLLGLLGLPIFTEGGGLVYLAKPGFGFLLGLIPAAFVTGLMSRRLGHSFWRLILACLGGLAAVYLIGLPYLYCIINFSLGKAMSVGTVLVSYCLIFLPFDGLKILVTALLGTRLVPLLSRIRGTT